MTTLNLQVGASADDAVERTTGAVHILNAALWIVDHVDEWFGFRWQNVTIGQGDDIITATLSVTIGSSLFDEPLHDFDCEDADNTTEFTTDANNISGRARTGNAVLWDVADLGANEGEFHSPPDLATPVQAVIDRGGWNSGNALVITCHQPSTVAARDLGLYGWDENAAMGAKLDIDYTATGVARRIFITHG